MSLERLPYSVGEVQGKDVKIDLLVTENVNDLSDFSELVRATGHISFAIFEYQGKQRTLFVETSNHDHLRRGLGISWDDLECCLYGSTNPVGQDVSKIGQLIFRNELGNEVHDRQKEEYIGRVIERIAPKFMNPQGVEIKWYDGLLSETVLMYYPSENGAQREI